jgi:vitamin B12 transporter
LRQLLLTAALAASAPAIAHADEVGELIVTAARLPTAPDLITGARVIDRAELAARQAVFATDVLATVPGVAIARNGAYGGVAAIRIRGASPDKTLVLIDGVPVDDPADPAGAYDPSSLQLADVERIEVISGPQSSLWGSDAIGGVVSFVTRELDGWRLEAEGGSHAAARGFAGLGHAEDAYALSATLAGFRTDGVSKAAAGTEADGFSTVTANLAGRLAVSDAVRLDGKLRYSEADVDIDGFPPPGFTLADTPDRNQSRAWSGYARATAEALGLTHKLSWSGYRLRRKNLSDFPASFDADRQVLRWTAETDHLVVGLERQTTGADLSGRPSLDLSNTAAFAVGRAEAGRLTVTGSLRWDDPDRVKGQATGRLAAAADLGAGVTLTASAGTGFKTPTISQAVCDFCFAPPVPLRPETAEGYDLRLGWRTGRLTAAATAWRLEVKDQIAYVGLRYVNIARTRSSGLELEADAWLTDALRLKLAYALTDAVDASTGRSQLRIPDHSGSAALFWTQGRWDAALTLRAESSQADTDLDGFSPIVRKGFAVADLAASYRIGDRVTLGARIENLADTRYQETYGFGESGRAAFVSLRFASR